MSKSSLILHIGPHKTGTTYIQKVLLDNRDKLLEEGVCYPEIGLKFYGHHDVVKAIKCNDVLLIDQLIESVPSNIHCVVLSSENFDELSIESIKYMASRLEDFDVRVIYYKREVSSLLYSNWQESVKHGSVSTWSEYFLKHLAYPYRSMIVNQSLVLDKYTSVFGKENIKIINYEAIMRQEGDIAVALLNQIGVSADISIPDKVENKSMPGAVTEILRVLNQSFENEKKLKGANVKRAFLSALNDITVKYKIKKLIKVVRNHNTPLILSDAFVIQMLEMKFRNKYIEKEDCSSYDVASSDVASSDVKLLPSSNWLCDRQGQELLAWLKEKVEVHLFR